MDKSSEVTTYINKGYNKHATTPHDMRHYLKQGENIPEINYHALEEAADGLFCGGSGLSLAEYTEITRKFYETLDLGSRGIPSIMLDTELLLTYFTRARNYVLKKTTPKKRSNNVLVIGCGTGRLAEMYIEMARKLGITGVTFNDLIEAHVQKTKEKLQKIYNTGATQSDHLQICGIDVNFVAGDFTNLNLAGIRYDIATAIWFVTSEVLDPSSSKNLRAHRLQFFNKVRECLVDQGIFIEDIPESGLPGFYLLSRMKTLHILRKNGILTGEEGNLSLTNIKKPNDGYPYHLRYLPYNGAHEKEMNLSGLYSVDQVSADIPTEAIITSEPDYLALFKEKTIYDVGNKVRRIITDLVAVSNHTGIDKKMKKVILWTPTPN